MGKTLYTAGSWILLYSLLKVTKGVKAGEPHGEMRVWRNPSDSRVECGWEGTRLEAKIQET